MGISIVWRYDDEEHSLDVDLKSDFVEEMTQAFNSGPWRLGLAHVERLRGMAAASRSNKSAYMRIIDLVTGQGSGPAWIIVGLGRL
jgi:hypothetical protein